MEFLCAIPIVFLFIILSIGQSKQTYRPHEMTQAQKWYAWHYILKK